MFGWCTEREDFRLFRLNRMDSVQETDHGFACRNVPMPDLSNEKLFPGGIRVKALFTADYTDMDNLIAWLLTFGAKTEVPEATKGRNSIRRTAIDPENTIKGADNL